ncbi:hypothetical protein [Catenulispora subtropica]|uniref:Uncharacterized protein n=1 Tax=Catenulispora subtropica TaxID=450798 RepID=A0ABN2SPU3_9ACTN
MTRWLRSYWAEEDIWFYFELDARGYPIRQIELEGPALDPIVAASQSEWRTAMQTGNGDEYHAVYGSVGEGGIHDWEGDGFDPEDLTAAEFETVWARARAACGARARTHTMPDV